MSEQAKIKALDVLGIWWNKPKKLSPALKKVVFDNLYNSPFLGYYSLLLKHAHHSQIPRLILRNLARNEQEAQLLGECLRNEQGMVVVGFMAEPGQSQLQAKLIADTIHVPAVLRYQKHTLTVKKHVEIAVAEELVMELQWLQDDSLHRVEFTIITPNPLVPFHLHCPALRLHGLPSDLPQLYRGPHRISVQD